MVPKEGVDPQGKMIEGYVEGLMRDIQYRGDHYKKPQLRTLYFGGGTPGILGKKVLMDIIDKVSLHFDLTYLEELSIELNPNPYEEILDLIQTLNTTYKDIPRIRYSFGIQSFDDSVLHLSGRQYSFAGIQKFLRDLREIKDGRNVFNLDFIAFGKWVRTKDDEYLFRDKARRERFQAVAQSWFIDSYSLYTLELFAGANREKTKRKEIDGHSHLDVSHVPFETDQEKITTEFERLKEVILDASYRRYELSNFASPGRESIHNMTYRNMWSYLGLGPSAASFLTGEYATDLPDIITNDQWQITNNKWVRFTISQNIFGYTKEQKLLEGSLQFINDKEFDIEKLFLALRTSRGVKDFSHYMHVLVPNWKALVEQYQEAWLLIYEDDRLQLTDEGLDVYNSIVSELLEL